MLTTVILSATTIGMVIVLRIITFLNFKIMAKENIFKIMVDQKPFDVENQFITGLEIKKLVGVSANYGVWLKVNGPNPDKEIADDEQVDLSQPGREHFFTGAKSTTEG